MHPRQKRLFLAKFSYINYKNRTRVQKRGAFVILGVSFLCLIFAVGIYIYFNIYNTHQKIAPGDPTQMEQRIGGQDSRA
jgi:small neutral amino acid transporter SnatA (MarC family)